MRNFKRYGDTVELWSEIVYDIQHSLRSIQSGFSNGVAPDNKDIDCLIDAAARLQSIQRDIQHHALPALFGDPPANKAKFSG